MGDDIVVEAEGKLTIGGITHRFLLALGSDDPERNRNMNWWTNLPDEEDEGMDAERRRHPWRSQSRPEGVVVIGQVKEGGQVRWDIRQAEDDVKEDKLAERDHPAGF